MPLEKLVTAIRNGNLEKVLKLLYKHPKLISETYSNQDILKLILNNQFCPEAPLDPDLVELITVQMKSLEQGKIKSYCSKNTVGKTLKDIALLGASAASSVNNALTAFFVPDPKVTLSPATPVVAIGILSITTIFAIFLDGIHVQEKLDTLYKSKKEFKVCECMLLQQKHACWE